MALPDWLRLLLAVLVIFRIARLITVDEGPFGIFSRFRKWTAGLAAQAPRYSWRWTLGEIFSCPYCIGIYLALPAALPFSKGSFTDFIIFWLAISGAQVFLEDLNQPPEVNL